MTENRQDEDEFERLLRESIDGKGTGGAAEDASWEGQEDVYIPSAQRPADVATEVQRKKGGEPFDGDQGWDRNIGSAVYAMRNQQVAADDDSALRSPSNLAAEEGEDGFTTEAPPVSPKQSDIQRSTPSEAGRTANWGLRIVSVGVVLALTTWLVLRDQQGIARLSAVEHHLESLQQQVTGDEQYVADRERMGTRLLDLETALAELSSIASSPQPEDASTISVDEETLQQQLSEQELRLEAVVDRLAALEKSASSLQKMLAEQSKAASHPGGKTPESGKVAGGGWVINLITVSRAEYAGQLLASYRNKGIEAEQLEINRGGKRLYRLRVGGFPTRAKAKDYADEVRSTLGLKETWVTRG